MRFASLFLLTLLFSSSLYAEVFTKCHNDVKRSYEFSDNKHLYSTDYGWIFFSENAEKNYQVYEPLLGLYVLNKKQAQKKLRILKKYPKRVIAFTKDTYLKNKIMNEGLGLDRLAPLEAPAYSGTALFGTCCTLRGFTTSDGALTSLYLLHSLKDKKTFATAGIRFKKIKGKIIVTDVNPFFAYNPFKKGDEILYFDAKKYSIENLANKILFSTLGTKHFFRVKRKGRIEPLAVFMKKRLGGGAIAHTYLEHLGMRFNKKMELIFVDAKSEAFKQGLKAGDLLISYDNKLTPNDIQLRKLVQMPRPKKMRLLFERRGMGFSTYFSPKNMLTL